MHAGAGAACHEPSLRSYMHTCIHAGAGAACHEPSLQSYICMLPTCMQELARHVTSPRFGLTCIHAYMQELARHVTNPRFGLAHTNDTASVIEPLDILRCVLTLAQTFFSKKKLQRHYTNKKTKLKRLSAPAYFEVCVHKWDIVCVCWCSVCALM